MLCCAVVLLHCSCGCGEEESREAGRVVCIYFKVHAGYVIQTACLSGRWTTVGNLYTAQHSPDKSTCISEMLAEKSIEKMPFLGNGHSTSN